MGAWIEQVHRRAAILLDQMQAARKLGEAHGGNAEDIARPYFAKIALLYENEMPWAQLMDESDLVVRMTGPSVDRPSPLLSAVSAAFDDIRDQVLRVTKAIIGLSSHDGTHDRGGGGLELALSGIARGSLVVGVRVMKPSENPIGAGLFGDDDPLYRSVKEAVRQIAVVTQYVSEAGLDDSVRARIPDPAVRDALTVATQRLSPTGKRGIDTVTLYSPEARERARELTPKVRRALSTELRHPVKTFQRRTVEGVVREIDLDARRFELRRVRGAGSIRCIYAEDYTHQAVKWLDRKLKATGGVEFGPNNEPRLLLVERATLVRERKPRQRRLALQRKK
jgi:hypothetical protein